MSTSPSAPYTIGEPIPPWVDAPLTRTDFVRYQGASGDMNPMHHDELFARDAGYPDVFSVGMLQAGVLGSYIADLYGPEAVRRFGVQFREQAWPGDVVTYSGSVAARRTADEGELLDLELTATRQTGGVHLTGWATVAVG